MRVRARLTNGLTVVASTLVASTLVASALVASALVALALVASALVAVPVAAHVRYTTDSDAHVDTLSLLVEVLSVPLNAVLLAGGGVAVAAIVVGYLLLQPLRRDVTVFRRAVTQYRDLLPWLLRLSFGLPLVGAGFAGYFFSPAVVPTGELFVAVNRLLLVAFGFFLLFGLGSRVVAFVALVVYLVGATYRPELVLAGEYVAGLVAIVLVGSGRPSADQILQTVAAADGTVYGEFDPFHRAATWFTDRVEPYRAYVPTIVRLGLGLVFLLLGVGEKLLAPGPALAVVDKYHLTAVVPVDPGLWVLGAAFAEIALGIALLLGAFTRAVSIVALLMFTLTLFGLPDDPVLAHITLFGLASTLIVTGAGPFSVDRAIEDRMEPPVRNVDSRPQDVDPSTD